MAKVKVNNEDFVVAYATSRTLDALVETTGMSVGAVKGRIKFLKDKGVKFPKFDNPNMIDDLAIARMNSLMKKHDIRKK